MKRDRAFSGKKLSHTIFEGMDIMFFLSYIKMRGCIS